MSTTHNPRVFTDFHHASLLNSLILLFEKRMGGEVYRPIGTEWYDRGFWKVHEHPATVQQFLGIGGATPDGSQPLNEVSEEDRKNLISNREIDSFMTRVYHCKDVETGETNKAITFNGFMMKPHWDYVIASIPQHIAPFRKMVDQHPSHPKLIYQIGNAWNITDAEAALLDGVMASAKLDVWGSKLGRNGQPLPVITYHQEFDRSIFSMNPLPFEPEKVISSFVNCFNEADIFKLDWELFQRIEQQMPDWKFNCFGGQCRDGCANGSQQLAEFMGISKFIWHTKYGGDGYGHIIHNAAAMGKPLIVRKQYYLGKLAEVLLRDGETCICIDGLSDAEIVAKIEHFSEPFRYMALRKQLNGIFEAIANFDFEYLEIKRFLESI